MNEEKADVIATTITTTIEDLTFHYKEKLLELGADSKHLPEDAAECFKNEMLSEYKANAKLIKEVLDLEIKLSLKKIALNQKDNKLAYEHERKKRKIELRFNRLNNKRERKEFKRSLYHPGLDERPEEPPAAPQEAIASTAREGAEQVQTPHLSAPKQSLGKISQNEDTQKQIDGGGTSVAPPPSCWCQMKHQIKNRIEPNLRPAKIYLSHLSQWRKFGEKLCQKGYTKTQTKRG